MDRTEEMFALYRAIFEVSGDPAIGLKLGTEERIERYSPIAIAALYTRSFRDALQRIARYKQLTCPEEIKITERGDECAVQFLWLLADRPEPATLVDACFASIVAIGGRGTGRTVHPNGSNGTDHGAAAPLFVIGGSARAGLYGKYPSLTELDRGDLVFNVDFRSVYATVLEQWLKAPSEKVLGRKFPILPIV